MKITITGTPGSGKSTLARDLAKALDFDYFSVGDMRRQMAKERGMTLAEFNKLGEKESWTDEELDNHVTKLGKEKDDFIVEGRLAWHFVPDSIKIFLDADEEIRAERMVPRESVGEKFENVEEAIKANKERVESDRLRYKKYYNLDPYDMSHYDMILDSTDQTREETCKEALNLIEKVK